MITLATIILLQGLKKIDTVSNTAYDDINKFNKLSTSINPSLWRRTKSGH